MVIIIMNHKELKKNRMLRYFIDAASEIIENESIEAITVRKVASLAGYNSATLYNYFDNLDHLISMASLKFIKSYTDDLPNYLVDCKNAICRVLKVWECFCFHSYTSPKIYSSIFEKNGISPYPNNIREFYKIYPDYLSALPEDISEMLTKNDIYDRALILLHECVELGYFKAEDIEDINEMTLFIYQGILSSVLNKKFNGSVTEAVDKTMKYFKQIFRIHLIRDCNLDY